MNNALIIIALIFSAFSAGAYTRDQQLPWGDLDVGTKYHLIADIAYPDGIVLPKDSGLLLTEVQGGIGIVNFIFQNLTCTDYKIKAEMVMFNPDPADKVHDKSVGIELLENCVVSMWVEGRYFYDIGALAL